MLEVRIHFCRILPVLNNLPIFFHPGQYTSPDFQHKMHTAKCCTLKTDIASSLPVYQRAKVQETVPITAQCADLRTVCKVGIIHQILAVQADFFDKTEVVPIQRQAYTGRTKKSRRINILLPICYSAVHLKPIRSIIFRTCSPVCFRFPQCLCILP